MEPPAIPAAGANAVEGASSRPLHEPAMGRAGCPQPAVGHPDVTGPRRRGEDTAPYRPQVPEIEAQTPARENSLPAAEGVGNGAISPQQTLPDSLTPAANPLPYRDTKPVGAADFYLAINATFRFIHNQFGTDGLRQYWTDLGTRYSAPITAQWRAGGLPAIAAHWRAFFAAEPGAVVEVREENHTVAVEVRVCPAIQHLRANQREILPCFCQHCFFLSEAIAAPAGYTVRIAGGNGACRQTFHHRAAAPPAQDLAHITEAGPC